MRRNLKGRRFLAGLLWTTLAGLAMSGSAAPANAADVTAKQVADAIDRGVVYLKGAQNRTDGSWPEWVGQPGGTTALCALALLNCGVPPEDEAIQKALRYLRTKEKPGMVYSVALQTMVFCAAEPNKDRLAIARNVQWLEATQISNGHAKGAWAYSSDFGRGDNSNSQFALLALHEAEKVGVKVKQQTWRLTLDYWLRNQHDDGSWSYTPDEAEDRATGSMTCAGISSLIIASGKVSGGDAVVADDRIQCCSPHGDDAPVERALQWMGRHFSVASVPAARGGAGTGYLLYYLYGMERVGRLSGRRFLGEHDWYRAGAELLIAHQDKLSGYWKGASHSETNPHIATAFALLFLGKGRRPVVIAPLIHSVEAGLFGPATRHGDWNQHRSAIQNLTQSVSRAWKRELSWHSIDMRAAKGQDLAQTPVLFLSGSEQLRFSPEQKQLLREYIDQGGFIFAEANCGGDGFDRDFRALIAELFPDSPLRLLPPDHPVWFADGPVDPAYVRPLWGVEACCRTSVVYCPESLTCRWELWKPERGAPGEDYPAVVAKDIAAGMAIGHNVLAYATNRNLKDKLDPSVDLARSDTGPLTRSTMVMPKLSHSGGSDDAPNAWPNILRLAEDQLKLNISPEHRMLAPTDPQLFDYPLLFMHGRRTFRFSPAARKQLREYLDRGGVLFVDSICGSEAFAQAFRAEMKAIFPEQELARLPADHPIFSDELHGYNLSRVTLRNPRERRVDERLAASLSDIEPRLEGIEIDGRLAVIFSPYDISCAMENSESLECKGYIKSDAAKIGVNVLLYGLLQ
ncbi:DUF4159 domain-containing protein [Lignipirellula cremea]|nr:DUF4159 domain-containing protein [Lignipirellula cremea]